MSPTNKDSGATRMAGAHIFHEVQHPELDTLGLVAIRDFLKKRARYLRLETQNNKADKAKSRRPLLWLRLIRGYLRTYRYGKDRCGFGR
jgi:hypothetical protein